MEPANEAPLVRITRRKALTLGGMGALGVALAACGSSTTSGSSATTAGAGGPTSGTGGTTPGSVRSVVLDDATKQQLDDLLAQGLKATGVPGVSAGVWIGGAEWRRSLGVADLTTNAAYRDDDKARMASITKTFTGTAVLQLVDASELTLDDKLSTYVPGIANGDAITIEQLLNMSSGVFDYTSDQAFVTAFDANPTMPWSFEQTVGIIKANPPAFAPGAKVQYCDSNYALLTAIVEKVTGRTLGQVITTEIVEKLGLADTSYPTSAQMPTPHPTAYLPDITGATDPKKPYPFDNATKPPTVVNEVNPDLSTGAGAMISSVRDLRRWAEELGQGTLLSKPTQAKRLATTMMTGQNVAGYGLGLLNIGSLIGHNGAIVGYNAFAMTYPAAGATFVAVSNESNNFTSATTEIMLPIVKALYPQALSS